MNEVHSDIKYKVNISVIIPVYNTREYLKKCFDSLMNQTIHCIEFVIIDDGSFDGSERICDIYAKKDKRFIVKHKRNEGLASARNDGIKMAQGEFVMFVDSDDWVEPNFCELPYCVAVEEQADLVVFQYVLHKKNHVVPRRKFPHEGVVPEREVLTRYWSFASSVVWNKLYKRTLFQGVYYPVGHLCEDGAVTHYIVHSARRIVLMNKYLYHYRGYRSGSIARNISEQYTKDIVQYSFDRLNALQKWGYDYKDEEKKIALLLLMVLGRKGGLFSWCDRILREDYYFPHNASRKQKAMFLAYRFSPRVLFEVISVLSGMRAKYSSMNGNKDNKK